MDFQAAVLWRLEVMDFGLYGRGCVCCGLYCGGCMDAGRVVGLYCAGCMVEAGCFVEVVGWNL